MYYKITKTAKSNMHKNKKSRIQIMTPAFDNR